MTPAPRRKPAVYDPGPVSLADAVDRQPEAPAVKPGRTLPASIEPMLGIDDLAAILSCSRQLVEREATPEAAVVETNTKTRSTHDLCYTIMQEGNPREEPVIDATVIWDLEDDPEGNVQHLAEHGITVEEGRRGSQRPPEPNGSEPTNGPAAGFRLDFDRQVHHGHLGRGIGRPPDDLLIC